MPLLTLPLSDDLHRALADQARANGRSVEEEVLRRLEADTDRPSTDEPARQARAFGAMLRARGFVPMSREELDATIDEGRP
jgi:hypothetical protein